MSYSLIVIDAQQFFLRALPDNVYGKLIKNLDLEIRTAKENDSNIIFVEFENFGPTIESFKELVAGYKSVYFVSKQNPGGASEIKKKMNKENLSFDNLKICGAYTSACVYHTVVGLKKFYPEARIQVLANACGDWDYSHEHGLKEMVSYAEIKGGLN